MQNIAGNIKIIFARETPVTSEKVLSLDHVKEKHLEFLPEGGIKLDLRGKPWKEVFRELKEVLKKLKI